MNAIPQITPLLPEQWHSAYAIMQQTQPGTWSSATFKQSITMPNQARQLMLAEECVGFYIIQTLNTANFTEWNLEEIAVSPRFQGRGLGRILLEDLIAQARIAQIDDLFLEVRASNQVAMHLYSTVGFIQIDVRKNYYSPIVDPLVAEQPPGGLAMNTAEDAIVMRWSNS